MTLAVGGARRRVVDEGLDETGVPRAAPHASRGKQVAKVGHVGGRSFDPEFTERPVGASDDGDKVIVRLVDDDLAQQGVVARVRFVPGVGHGVDPHPRTSGRVEGHNCPAPLEVDSALEGHASRLGHVALLAEPHLGERCTGGDLELEGDEVESGDGFGHRVLDLEARVRFEKGEPPAGDVDEELDRGQAPESDRSTERDGPVEHGGPKFGVECDSHGGSNLDDLLAVALQAAVTIPEVHELGPVAEKLDLDVAHPNGQFLDEEAAVAERGQSLGFAPLEHLREFATVANRTHASAAAAGDGLHHHRAARP